MINFGKEVSVGSIAKELKALWAGDTSRTNACMMNLAVFTELPEQMERNFQSISALTQDHSCRALSIALDRHSKENCMTTWLTAHCNMSNGKKTVCCEQLTFLLKGYRPGRLRNTVFANLNSDLPLVFWWQGDLTEVFEPRLYTLIDRFIFDSKDWADPKAGYVRLLEAASDVQRRFVIQDLSWTRSYQARMSFAALFDESLTQNEFANITHAFVKVGSGLETTGLLILAWMATQAGWTFHSRDGEGAYSFENAEGVIIHATLEAEGEISVAEIGVASETSSFLVQHDETEPKVFHQVIQTEAGSHEFTSLSGAQDTDALVAEQLSRGGKNALLRKVTPLFMELLG